MITKKLKDPQNSFEKYIYLKKNPNWRLPTRDEAKRIEEDNDYSYFLESNQINANISYSEKKILLLVYAPRKAHVTFAKFMEDILDVLAKEAGISVEELTKPYFNPTYAEYRKTARLVPMPGDEIKWRVDSHDN